MEGGREGGKEGGGVPHSSPVLSLSHREAERGGVSFPMRDILSRISRTSSRIPPKERAARDER